MKVLFLGTGGTIPTERRKHPALAIRREGEVFLFDCGEGTQSQIFKARLGIFPIRAIFISHLHGDPVLGIPGLLMTMCQGDRSQRLLIIGPSGIANWIRHIFEDLDFNPFFEIDIEEVESGLVFETPHYWVSAFPLDHGVPTLGYCFQETERPGRFLVDEALRLGVPQGPLWGKLQSGQTVVLAGGHRVESQQVLGSPRRGLKVVYAVDSRPCDETVRVAFQADLLIHDSMFSSEDGDKARARGHSTVVEAAEIARKAQVRRLTLTHLSPRYRGEEDRFIQEARAIFPETTVAEDLMEIEICHVDS